MISYMLSKTNVNNSGSMKSRKKPFLRVKKSVIRSFNTYFAPIETDGGGLIMEADFSRGDESKKLNRLVINNGTCQILAGGGLQQATFGVPIRGRFLVRETGNV